MQDRWDVYYALVDRLCCSLTDLPDWISEDSLYRQATRLRSAIEHRGGDRLDYEAADRMFYKFDRVFNECR